MLWVIFALLSAFADAGYYIFNKKAVEKISIYAVPAFIFGVSGLVLLSISVVQGIPVIQKNFFGFVFLGASLATISTVIMLKALKSAEISAVIPLISFTPIFLMITSFLMLNEKVSISGSLGIILIVAGAYILNLEKTKDFLYPFKALFKNKGSLLIIIVAMIYAIIANVDKIILLKSNMYFAYGVESLVISLFFILICLFRKEDLNGLKASFSVLAAGAASQFISAIGYGMAVSMQIVPYVISLKRTSILLSVLFGSLVFKEQKTKQRLIASLVMFLGVVLIALK